MALDKQDENYQEGWEDASKHFLKNYVPMEHLLKTFDKFFDKINSLKKISKAVFNHFKFDKDLAEKYMVSAEEKEKNLNKILELISKQGETDGGKETTKT